MVAEVVGANIIFRSQFRTLVCRHDTIITKSSVQDVRAAVGSVDLDGDISGARVTIVARQRFVRALYPRRAVLEYQLANNGSCLLNYRSSTSNVFAS